MDKISCLVIFRTITVVICLLGPSTRASDFTHRSTCEFYLQGPNHIEEAAEDFANMIFDKPLILYDLNVNLSPVLAGHAILQNLAEEKTVLTIKQSRVDSKLILSFNLGKNAKERIFEGRVMRPLYSLFGTNQTGQQVQEIMDSLGGGLVNDPAVFDQLAPHFLKQERRLGVILQELADDIRLYLSAGYSAGTLTVTIGFDVPCEDLATDLRTQSQNESRLLLRVVELKSDSGTYCRIPAAVFHPRLLRGISRI